MKVNNNTFWLGLGKRLVTISLVAASTASFASWRSTASETTEPYRTWQMPGTNIASPSGYGANWGQAYLGGGYQAQGRNGAASDASMGVGFGIGNASKIVGLDITLGIADISAFNSGALSAKLHRVFANGFGVGVGYESFAQFGDGLSDKAKSLYGSVSKIFFLKDETQWFSALTLTAGVGNGRFRSNDDFNADVSGVNLFGSAAIRVKQPVAFIADWSGQSLNLGFSITPIRTFGFFINPVLADVAGISGQSARFVLGMGVATSFN